MPGPCRAAAFSVGDNRRVHRTGAAALPGLALVLLAGLAACGPVPPNPLQVIVDHDGGVDDLVAISLLMQSPAVHVRAITICPADSYLEPATKATQLFVDRLGGTHITIAQGHSEGTNPFPAQWRGDAGHVLDIPALQGVQPLSVNPIVAEDAAHHLVSVLSGTQAFTILETGPLTNIADALALNPSIAKNITRIYVMGGAVRVKGNVEHAGHDGSAEWNIFNQPQAAADVIRSGVPITLVPLDATNRVPLRKAFLDRLSMQPSIASQLSAQAWGKTYNFQQQGVTPYYFWDTLTAAAMLDRSLVTLQNLRISVATGGTSQGRTSEDARGNLVEVALDADQDKVERIFLDLLGRSNQ